MKIGTVEVELKPKDIEGIKNKIKEDLINEVFVEVVRCKDCIFWNKDENVLRGICDEWSDYEDGISRYTGSDDYCSYGERKDGEEE